MKRSVYSRMLETKPGAHLETVGTSAAFGKAMEHMLDFFRRDLGEFLMDHFSWSQVIDGSNRVKVLMTGIALQVEEEEDDEDHVTLG